MYDVDQVIDLLEGRVDLGTLAKSGFGLGPGLLDGAVGITFVLGLLDRICKCSIVALA